MQHNDERPPTSGRPSLLSPEQQAESGGPRILGGIAADATPSTGPSRGSKRSWIAASVVAVAAIGAGAAFWLSSEGEKEIVLASSDPVPPMAAPTVPSASEPGVAPPPASANPEAEQVSTAAILQDVPPAPVKPALAGSKKPADELTRLLEHPAAAAKAPLAMASAPVPATAAEVKAVPKLAPKKVAAATPKAAAKPAHKAAPHALAEAPVKKKSELHPKAAPGMDSDVTLLAALVAHSKAIQPKKTSAAGEKLRHCKTLGSVDEAEQCRARLCAASAKNEPECKAPRIAKAATET